MGIQPPAMELEGRSFPKRHVERNRMGKTCAGRGGREAVEQPPCASLFIPGE
jgi:hypothetical protein